MNPSASTFDYWRPFKPMLPIIDQENPLLTRRGQKLEIKFDDSYYVQGARDENMHSPTDPTFSKVPAERGWACRIEVVSPPLNGIIRPAGDGRTLHYTPRRGYQGPDCFNYRMATDFQQSEVGTAYILVTPYYYLSLLMAHNGPNKYRLRIRLTDDSELTPSMYLYTLSATQTNLVADSSSGTVRIFEKDIQTFQTYLDYYYYNLCLEEAPIVRSLPQYIALNATSDRDLPQGYIGHSQTLYNPTGYRGDLIIKANLHHKKVWRTYKYWSGGRWFERSMLQVDLTDFDTLEVRLSDWFGPRWWDSGNILPIGHPV